MSVNASIGKVPGDKNKNWFVKIILDDFSFKSIKNAHKMLDKGIYEIKEVKKMILRMNNLIIKNKK